MNNADVAYVTEVQVCFGHKNSLGMHELKVTANSLACVCREQSGL